MHNSCYAASIVGVRVGRELHTIIRRKTGTESTASIKLWKNSEFSAVESMPLPTLSIMTYPKEEA